MKEIICDELKEKVKNKEDFLLVDVREVFENEAGNLGGVNIPTSVIQEEFSKIPKDKEVIIYCQTGSRSSMVINFLEQNFGYDKLINLSGGILMCN